MADLRQEGFSLLEVLIALLIAGILIAVVGISLVGNIRAASAADALPTARRLMHTLQCRHYLGLDAADLAKGHSDWRVLPPDRSKETDESEAWTVWTMESIDRTSLAIDFALRAKDGAPADSAQTARE